MSRISKMKRLQRGQLPLLTISSLEHNLQNVCPHGIKAEPLCLTMHTQHLYSPLLLPLPFSSSASSSFPFPSFLSFSSPSSSSSSSSSPRNVHPASQVDPATHSQALIDLLELDISREVIGAHSYTLHKNCLISFF